MLQHWKKDVEQNGKNSLEEWQLVLLLYDVKITILCVEVAQGNFNLSKKSINNTLTSN